jgi:glycosyltransferase involved in cell wall biosynthesis
VSQRLIRAAQDLGVPESKLRLVYNGVDRGRFPTSDKAPARHALGIPKDAELVVYVGLLADYKGTRDLLAALSELSRLRPGVITAFVGDGPLAAEVQARAEHGDPAARVMAVGRVRHDEVPQWMAAADVLCLPSWDEGMPNVVREAHAIGRPVVATDVGGLPEAICKAELGRLVPPRDPAALGRALAEMLADKDRLSPEQISREAVVPSWEESGAALLAVIEEAIQRR